MEHELPDDIVLLGGRREEAIPTPVASAMEQRASSNSDVI